MTRTTAPDHDRRTGADATGPLRIGTAGWTVPKVHQAVFPTDGSHLERYAARFSAVEINSSFYRPHRPSTYERWAASVPDGFRFAVKMPKAVTHERRLEHAGELAARFLDEVSALGDRLGPLLVQLPPSLAFTSGLAIRFLSDLRRSFAGPVVCEPRHASWFTPEVDRLLVDLKIARVAAHPAPAAGADAPGGWRGLAYWRMHGSPKMYYSAYSADALDRLAAKLQAEAAAGCEVWCILDNTAAFAATGDALNLIQTLACGGGGADGEIRRHPGLEDQP
ncbi:DUF72 domain-containing protein [Consotaella aegiceratis]|uniref:DUF72 domain-containing protein n=1 Tax=Consotaella aegiceratis TaxID=3097961 RepID=UPI002F3F14A8